MRAADTLTAHHEAIDPRQWRVIGQMQHNGITYGTAEPLPEMTMVDALRYERQGTLMRVTDATVAESYLEGPDVVVLQAILDTRPTLEVLDQMLALAQRNSRSKVLELALMLARRGYGAAHPTGE